jgi:hypothetical protein
MIRIEFIRRKLHLISEDLSMLLQFKDEPLEYLSKFLDTIGK